MSAAHAPYRHEIMRHLIAQLSHRRISAYRSARNSVASWRSAASSASAPSVSSTINQLEKQYLVNIISGGGGISIGVMAKSGGNVSASSGASAGGGSGIGVAKWHRVA